MKKGWEVKTLGDVCEIVKDKPLKFEGEKNYYSTGSIQNNNLYSAPQKVSYTKKPSRANLYPSLYDVGFAKMKFTNKTILVDNGFMGSIFSTGFCFLRPKSNLYYKYLLYFISSDLFQEKKDFYAGDGIMGGVRNKEVEKIEIPLPPLSEQKRIVKILDDAFNAIDKAKENIEKNINNSKELFESYLENVFNNGNNNWEVKNLGEVLTIERGGSPRPIKKYITEDPDGINWIKISDATASDKYIYKTKQKITKEGLKKTRLVNEGDFILSNSMSFGRPYIMKTTGCIHDGWLVLKQDSKILFDTNFLYYLLSSRHFFNQFSCLAVGSTVNNLNISLVSSVKVPILPLTEQKNIVSKIDGLSEQTKKLEKNYQKKLEDLEEMKKSILQKAFNGEL